MDLSPSAVTAALVGVKSRLQIFGLQRWINTYPEEPLLAVLPGVGHAPYLENPGSYNGAIGAFLADL
jgi:pimeloyl-ACP methyl ester carboxylesterase